MIAAPAWEGAVVKDKFIVLQPLSAESAENENSGTLWKTLGAGHPVAATEGQPCPTRAKATRLQTVFADTSPMTQAVTSER